MNVDGKKRKRRSRFRLAGARERLHGGENQVLRLGSEQSSLGHIDEQSPAFDPIPPLPQSEHEDFLAEEGQLFQLDNGLPIETHYFGDEPVDGGIRHDTAASTSKEHFFPAPCAADTFQEMNTIVSSSQLLPNVDVSVPLPIGNWQILWGLIMTSGSMRLTKPQYQAMRIIADTLGRLSNSSWRTEDALPYSPPDVSQQVIQALPHYSTLYKRFKPILYKTLAVRGDQQMERVCIRKAGARAKTYSADGLPHTPVHVILPSEYARADVACEPVYRLMKSTSLCGSSPVECIDSWPIISARPWFYGAKRYITVDSTADGSSKASFAESGDVVSIRLLICCTLQKEMSDNFMHSETDDRSTKLLGQIVHIWTVHHDKRKSDPSFLDALPSSLSDRDVSIVSKLQFCSYSSPSDALNVEIPELPAVEDDSDNERTGRTAVTSAQRHQRVLPQMREAARARNSALQERRERMEAAWAGWCKPLLKPGDLIALIRPAARNNTSGSRILLVYRFWTESNERSKHVMWLPSTNSIACTRGSCTVFHGFSPLEQNKPDMTTDVHSLHLVSHAMSLRGPERFSPISSSGFLSSGERYFIYRFLLFWDGFEITAGKSASGEGFYMLCLNLPVRARASPSAVRVISLAPPGVANEGIFRRINQDIVKGMTDGFEDIDAEGNSVRIFLDLVGFIGDTPALNSTLDVLGHTANLCCHLCRFARSSTIVLGSRYTGQGFHASCTPTARGFFQHCGVRDCNPSEETCRLLGMSPSTAQQHLPLHELREAMLASRDSIPTTSEGDTILTGLLDPYRSCLVAPDHVLTGHFRDCVNLTIRLLPTKTHRISAENHIKALLYECGLPTKNRLIDIDKKALYSMSMTELYSLSVVAHIGFIRACASIASIEHISSRCRDSFDVLASCAALISRLWNPTTKERTVSFSKEYIISLQEQATYHIELVRDLCTMSDSKLSLLQNPRTTRTLKLELSKEYRDRFTAIKALDKPNVHRLYELVFSTLPMVGFVSRIGELVLEKAHQTLKRAVKQSNNKDVQLHAVLCAVFSDWQGRLTLQIRGAMQNSPACLRGCFRLLAGRERIMQLKGRLSDAHAAMVRAALGPDCCVPVILEAEAKSVLSPRAFGYGDLNWVLEKDIDLYSSTTPNSTTVRSNVYRAFRRYCSEPDARPTLVFGAKARCALPNGAQHVVVNTGDVLQINCDERTTVERDVSSRQHSGLGLAHGFRLWGVVALFTRKHLHGKDVFWAAVYPCVSQYYVPNPNEAMFNRTRYVFSREISFLILDHQVRRSAVIRLCAHPGCLINSGSGETAHEDTCNPFTGTPFFLLTMEEGYPPRSG